MTGPDPDPMVEAARLAYLDAQATADAHYAVAYAASGGKPSPSTKLGFKAYVADHDAEVAYEKYTDLWRDVYLPKADAAADPEIEAERELERFEWQADAEQELEP
jgi:hypothetical protein